MKFQKNQTFFGEKSQAFARIIISLAYLHRWHEEKKILKRSLVKKTEAN